MGPPFKGLQKKGTGPPYLIVVYVYLSTVQSKLCIQLGLCYSSQPNVPKGFLDLLLFINEIGLLLFKK